MPAFVSKLQYKTCEKGEYYDEKLRDLDETIKLINNFPWYKEKYAPIELTGASITILDNNGNFFKIGNHYGGRYHLYYLDRYKKFYEYYPLDIDEVYNYIRDFFAGNLNLQKFEKHFTGIGKKSYFLTKQFSYTIKPWRIILFLTFWIIPFLFGLTCFIMLITKDQLNWGIAIPISFMIVFGLIIRNQFFKFYNNRFEYLQISRGNNIFIFGKNGDEIREYNKADIDKIINYTPQNNRSPNIIEFTDILFKDGSNIRFSNILLSSSELRYKFADYWKLEPIIIEKNTFRMS
jgi:hypothetical protein